MDGKRHSLLARQLKKRFGSEGGLPAELADFVDVVDAAYRQFDEDRGMLERSLDLSSQELLARNSQMRAMLSAFPDIFFHLDEGGRILDCSASNAEDLYLPLAQLEGRRVQDILPENLGPRFAEAVRRVVASGTAANLDYALTVPSGEKHWEARIVKADRGRLLMIVRDITARANTQEALKRIENQFHQSQKMEGIGRLAGGIAHDFNNLLTTILGLTEITIMSLEPDTPIVVDLKEILATGRRAADLTHQLLAFSRRQVIEPRIVDLNEAIPLVTKLLRRLIGEDIELMTKLGPSLGKVRVDPGQLEQVIVNLCVNARDAMPGGGALIVETANVSVGSEYVRHNPGAIAGEYVRFAVTDGGAGMTDEVKSHLFEPFFTTKPPGKGTGLGLATCYGIIKQHGGYISVDSLLGRGSTFSVLLPRYDGPLPVLPDPNGLKKTPRGSETVLVVEDEKSVRELIVRVLVAQGYEVLAAPDGREGRSIAGSDAARKIRLLVTDIVMPQISGLELADSLKVIRPDMKVLFTTGYTDDASLRRGDPLPGEALLHKPFLPHDLAVKVRAVLDA